MKDSKPAGRKTVWYDSRFYRANVVWEDSTLRFRDIHLFDERLPSAYLTQPGTSTQCLYTTLPLVDGFNWSSTTETAGLRLVEKMADGSWRPVPVGMPGGRGDLARRTDRDDSDPRRRFVPDGFR